MPFTPGQPYRGPLYMELTDGSVLRIADVTDMEIQVPAGDPDPDQSWRLRQASRETGREIIVEDHVLVQYPTEQEAIAAAMHLPAGIVVLAYRWEREEYNCCYVVTYLRTGPQPDWWPPAQA